MASHLEGTGEEGGLALSWSWNTSLDSTFIVNKRVGDAVLNVVVAMY